MAILGPFSVLSLRRWAFDVGCSAIRRPQAEIFDIHFPPFVIPSAAEESIKTKPALPASTGYILNLSYLSCEALSFRAKWGV